AKEWGKDGIRVNCIAPGLIRTEFSRALWDPQMGARGGNEGAPLARIGEPNEVAGAAVYLASAASSFTTGETIAVDGGSLA
ncbi:MAG: SDR family oxidoreductase, partial [Dehalococcoidia bacterium]